MAELVSSVPGVYEALLGLVEAAAAEQDPPVNVFPFELGQYEPAQYVMVSEIRGPRFEWESMGDFSQKEIYSIHGKATVFSGDSVATNPTLAIQVLSETFALFHACVMTPVMSNRVMPLLGTEGPSPYLMLPEDAQYTSGPSNMAGGQAGWEGVLDWGFRFEAVVTPTQPLETEILLETSELLETDA